MKIKNLKISICAALCFIALGFYGCATKLATPVVVPANPATGAPASTNFYVPNTAVMQGVTYTNAAAPLIPAPWGTAATAVATLAALVASYIAQKKNAQANASGNAAAALSAAIVQHTDSAALTTAALNAGQTNGS
ncbi:MAG: hypothetical protein ABSE90_12005, partial [Verrucomicrobiota bacterium]